MIYHLNVLLENFKNLGKEWAWHHLMGCHALLSINAPFHLNWFGGSQIMGISKFIENIQDHISELSFVV